LGRRRRRRGPVRPRCTALDELSPTHGHPRDAGGRRAARGRRRLARHAGRSAATPLAHLTRRAMMPHDEPIRLGPGPEFDLIRQFLARAGATASPAADAVQVGPGDDCTVVDGIALSTDLSVEGIHFRREWLEPEEIGYRAAAAALSDLAAVAAQPIGVLCSLACAGDDAAAYGPRVMDGVRSAAADVGAALLGGDLARSPGPLL